MKSRCYTPSTGSFKNYGGKGVTVCDEWRRDFVAFAMHVGHPPSDAHTLDRINPFGNYEPGNVRWATQAEQQRNRRKHYTNRQGE
jgi:hypothetical protein